MRFNGLVVLVLFVLLLITIVGNIRRFDFGIVTVKASPIFSDGFESGDFSAWGGTGGGGTVEVVSNPVYQGNYSAHLSNGAEDTTPYLWTDFPSMNTAYARVYVNFADLSLGYDPTRQTRAIFFVFGMSEYLSYRSEISVYNDNGNYVWALKITDDSGTPYFVTSSQTVATNTWYCVEVKRVADSSLGETRLYIDGTEILNVTGIDTAVTGQSDLLLLDGETYGQVSLTNNYFDCAVIDSSYIGPLSSATDTTPPTYENMETNTTVAGTPCSLNCLVNDDTNVSTYIFSTNNTGTWINNTAIIFTSFYNSTAAWANVTQTMNDTVGNVVSYMWYANDTSNNWSSSDQYNLTLTAPPSPAILSPSNTTYTTADVPLTFTINDVTSWRGYSLDGQGNVTIVGNTTLLGLSDGSHNVIVYANDTFGNMGASSLMYFEVDTTAPSIAILSPENLTYATSDLPLTFTINESASWIGYSLDDLANATITGNTTLAGLSEGSHTIIVYANDTVGNMGASQTVHFAVVVPDIAVVNMTASKTVVGQGFSINVSVTAANNGGSTEIFNVTAYANQTIIGEMYNVTLTTANSTMVSFTWNTTGFAYGNYTINVYAWPVPGEINTADNNFTGGMVTVTIPGDINGDFKVSLTDLVYLANAYGTTPASGGTPGTQHAWNPNADINGNGIVDLADLVLLANHYGQHYP